MKKLIVVFIFLAVISPVFSQNNSGNSTSDIYYVNISVERVYPTSKGYLVQYRKGNSITTIGLPGEWFSSAAGKAEILQLPRGRNWPTMSVFYRDGEFSHLRLYVHRSKGHQTWGSVPQSADVSRYFENTDTITIEY